MASIALHDLNERQREAVTHPGGPLLVVAGAGTGKTRVLTHRVAWLVEQGVHPSSILAITFTNRAAGVMRDRLADLDVDRGVWAGTFHGFGAYLLRRHGEDVGIDPQFTILDRDDQRRLLTRLIKEIGHHASGFKPRELAALISLRKQGRQSIREDRRLESRGLMSAFDEAFAEYQRKLTQGSLVDFDDLLAEAVRLLVDVEDTRELLRERFTHILVDEYQDTNVMQRDLVMRLLSPTRDLTAVGDPDQSIYSWRGAAVKNILNFERDVEGATTVVLDQNYRSTKAILYASEAVIDKNEDRPKKVLRTENPEGTPMHVVRCANADDEGLAIARLAERWAEHGGALGEMAVFYRVNALSRAIELGFRTLRVPYIVVAGIEFFQRREVKDLVCYLRLVVNPGDIAAFDRVVNVPKRGIGATSLSRFRVAAAEQGLSAAMWAARGEVGVLKGRARKGMERFAELLAVARAMPDTPVAPILNHLVRATGYRNALEDHPDEMERQRVENIDELIAYARQYDATEAEGNLLGFLERVALVSDQDDPEDPVGRVNLMSVHAAKGLEYDHVVIAGSESGLFPHERSMEEHESREEERRLFYVAMTRARKRLTATYAMRRMTYQGPTSPLPSPYLLDVPEAWRTVEDRVSGRPGQVLRRRPRFDYADPSVLGPDAYDRDPEPQVGQHDEAQPETNEVVREESLGVAVGDRVAHPFFGEGVLTAVAGAGARTRVTVDFSAYGEKQLLLTYARLERI